MVAKMYIKKNGKKEVFDKKQVIKAKVNEYNRVVYYLENYFLKPVITDVVYQDKLNVWQNNNGWEYMYCIE